MSDGVNRYDAFISYSHAVESELAGKLQSGLHRLAKPVFQRRAMRVYRDETDLGADPAMWTRLSESLDLKQIPHRHRFPGVSCVAVEQHGDRALDRSW